MAIDVHAHFVPPGILETLSSKGRDFGVELVETEPGCHCCRFEGGQTIRPFFDGLLDVDARLADMDRQGIERQILTLWTDIFGYGLPAAKGRDWHVVMNDCLARLAEAHDARFSWMGSVPLQDAALAAAELERTMAQGALGVIVSANVEERNLGECELDEFWAACVARRAPVFIHPTQAAPPPRTRRFSLAQICGYTYDTTLTVGSMISAGVIDRYPGLELILSHGGGALPYLIGRFDRMHAAADGSVTGNVAARPPSDYLSAFHYDTILHDGAALRFLRDRVGVDRMLLGSDVPFPPGDPDPLSTLRGAEFSQHEIDRIAEANPRALFRIEG
jgi:aminocarboxymuconate-semialdehyde decarboxylase